MEIIGSSSDDSSFSFDQKLVSSLKSNNFSDIVNSLNEFTKFYNSYGFKQEYIPKLLISNIKYVIMRINDLIIQRLSYRLLSSISVSCPYKSKEIFAEGFLGICIPHIINILDFEISVYCYRIFCSISRAFPVEVSTNIGSSPFFQNIKSYSDEDQVLGLKTLSEVSASTVIKLNSDNLIILIQFMKSSNAHIVNNSAQIIKKYFDYSRKQDIPLNIVSQILILKSHIVSAQTWVLYLQILVKISQNTKLIPQIVEYIDFDFLLFNRFINQNNTQYFGFLFCLIENITPVVKNNSRFHQSTHKRPDLPREYVERIRFLLFKYLKTECVCISQCFLCLLSCINQDTILTSDEVGVLMSHSKNKSCLNDFLKLIAHCGKQKYFNESPVFIFIFQCINDIIDKVEFSTFINQNGLIIENSLHSKDILLKTIDEICVLITSVDFNPLVFIDTEILNHLNSLVLVCPDGHNGDLKIIADLLSKILIYVPFPEYDNFDMNDFIRVMSSACSIDIKKNHVTTSISIGYSDRMMSIDSYFVQHQNGMSLPNTSSPMISLFSNEQIHSLPLWRKYLIWKALSGTNLDFYYCVDKICYSNKESVYVTFGNVKESNADKFHQCSMENGPFSNRIRISPINSQFSHLETILLILKNIYLKSGYQMINNEFITRASHHLMNLRNVVLGKSMVVTLFYRNPFFFPLQIRQSAFLMMNQDIKLSMKTNIQQFHQVLDQPLPSIDPLKLYVNRDRIFEQGLFFLNSVFRDRSTVEVNFHGEEGVGSGPTSEFFFKLSQCFYLKDIKIFRNEDHSPSLFVHHSKGLFPSPNAPLYYIELLGVLVAKCLLSQYIIDLHFNEAFFSLLKQKTVTIRDIDPQLSKSLESKDGIIGMPFVYPGEDSLHLITNGDTYYVTPENYNEYVVLVESYTCGPHFQKIIEAFLVGFSSVYSFEYTNIFTEYEICKILHGDSINYSLKELKDSFDFGDGFNIDSPQIIMLIELLLEMGNEDRKDFFEYLTGFSCLPYGGISSIQPRITILKRETTRAPDTELPTVSTCTHFLKLPLYSTKEIMRKKLLYAIRESKGTFYLV